MTGPLQVPLHWQILNGYRRVNLFGGPNIGKSTAAPDLFSELKKRHLKVELVREDDVKMMAYQKRVPAGFDQVWLFGQQIYKEDNILRSGLDLVVTDSPILLNAYYGKFYNRHGWRGCMQTAEEFDMEYLPLNILLKRCDTKYDTNGRFEDASTAIQFDAFVEEQLSDKKYFTVNAHDHAGLLQIVLTECNIKS